MANLESYRNKGVVSPAQKPMTARILVNLRAESKPIPMMSPWDCYVELPKHTSTGHHYSSYHASDG
jgi:hypothetical protein